jgi:hypothetical protein
MKENFNVKGILEELERFTKTAQEEVDQVLTNAIAEAEAETEVSEAVDETVDEAVDEEETADEAADEEEAVDEEKTAEVEVLNEDLEKIAELEAQGQIIARAFINELNKFASLAANENYEKVATDNIENVQAQILTNIYKNLL